MKKSFQKPTGKEKLTPRGWYDKWHAFMYGDALAIQEYSEYQEKPFKKSVLKK